LQLLFRTAPGVGYNFVLMFSYFSVFTFFRYCDITVWFSRSLC